MAQFDIHATVPGTARAPYLLDIQSDLLDDLPTRLVIPFLPPDRFGKPVQRLNPLFDIEGAAYVLATADMLGLRLKALGPVVGSLRDRRLEIIRAVDFLLGGV